MDPQSYVSPALEVHTTPYDEGFVFNIILPRNTCSMSVAHVGAQADGCRWPLDSPPDRWLRCEVSKLLRPNTTLEFSSSLGAFLARGLMAQPFEILKGETLDSIQTVRETPLILQCILRC